MSCGPALDPHRNYVEARSFEGEVGTIGRNRVEQLSRRVIAIGPLVAIVGLEGDYYIRKNGGHANINKLNEIITDNDGFTRKWVQENGYQRSHGQRSSHKDELPGRMRRTVHLRGNEQEDQYERPSQVRSGYKNDRPPLQRRYRSDGYHRGDNGASSSWGLIQLVTSRILMTRAYLKFITARSVSREGSACSKWM